jgi:hypothetical protein
MNNLRFLAEIVHNKQDLFHNLRFDGNFVLIGARFYMSFGIANSLVQDLTLRDCYF